MANNGQGVNVSVGADLGALRQEFQAAQASVQSSLNDIINRLNGMGKATKKAGDDAEEMAKKVAKEHAKMAKEAEAAAKKIAKEQEAASRKAEKEATEAAKKIAKEQENASKKAEKDAADSARKIAKEQEAAGKKAAKEAAETARKVAKEQEALTKKAAAEAAEMGRKVAKEHEELTKKAAAEAAEMKRKVAKEHEELTKKAAQEAAQASAKTKESFGGMATGVGGSVGSIVGKLVALVAAYASLQAVMSGFTSTVDFIGQTDELAQNMGISTERASAYREALKGLDIDANTLTGAYSKMQGTLSSNQKMFEKWGVSVRDSSGNLKSQEAVFQSTLKRIGEFKDGSDRAAAAQALLGVDLDTANKLLALNEENLSAGAAAAEQFGTVVTDEMVAAHDDFNTAMATMGSAVDGLKLAFFAELIPAVTAFVNFISANLPAAIDFMKSAAEMVIGVFEDLWDIGSFIFESLGEILETFFGDSSVDAIDWSAVMNTAADIVKGAVVLLMGLFKALAETVKFGGEVIGIAVGGIIDAFIGLATLNPARIANAATTALSMVEERAKKARENIAADVAATIGSLQNLANGQGIAKGGTNPFARPAGGGSAVPAPGPTYNRTPPTGGTRVTNQNQRGGGGGGGGGGEDEASKLIKAQTQLIKAELQAQLDLLREKNRQERAELDESLRQNQVSYKEYYARVAAMAKEESAKSIEIKQKELEELERLQKTAKSESDKVGIQAQIVKLQSEINILKQKELSIDKESARELAQKMEDMKKMRTDLLAEVSRESGIMDMDAEFAALEQRYEEMKERLTAEGDSEGLSALEKLLGYKKAQLEIAKFQQDYDLLNTNLKTKELELEAEAKRRGLTDGQIQQQKLALQQEEIENLIQIKEKQIEVATAAYGAGSIQVAQLRQVVAELKLAKTETNEFAKGLNETLSSSFNTLFNDIMSGTKSAKDIFKDFVGSIVQGINQMVAQILSKRVMNAFSSLGNGGGGGGGGGGGFFSSIIGAFMGGKESGGFTASATKPYLVGERGPEMFIPRTSGDIIDAGDLRALAKGGGRNSSVVVNISTPDPHAFRKTEGQTMAELSKTVTRANNRNN